MKIALTTFGGLSPRTDAVMLPDHGAQVAQDVRLHAGALRGWRKPAPLSPPISAINSVKTIWYDPGSGEWLQWDTDVDVVHGPVADADSKLRYYYTGDTEPRKTDSDMIGTVTPYYKMGVPAPTSAPTLAGDGLGAGTAEDHVYVFTYINTFSGIEEESAPSPPVTMVAWQPGDTITVTWTDTPPAIGYNITKRRLYRSNGSAYLFVDEQAIANATYADSKLNDALGEGLSSLEYDPPPSEMTGLVSMANGILAGFYANVLCFSEPYQPHAWPVSYQLTVDSTIVGLVAVGQGLYVLTTGHPYYCAGSTPSAMTLERVSKYAPCMNKRSAAADGAGCLYASYNGVAYLQGASVRLLTSGAFTQEEWSARLPWSMYGIYYDDRYHLWYPKTDGDSLVMDGSWAMDGSEEMDGIVGLAGDYGEGMVFDTTVAEAPLTMMSTYTEAAHIRSDTGKLYLAYDGQIMQFDADELNRTPYEWRSKIFMLPHPVNFSAIQVYGDFSAATDIAAMQASIQAILENNATLWASGAYDGGWAQAGINQYEWNGSPLTTIPELPDSLSTNLRVYADGLLVYETQVTDDGMYRLPGGFKSDHWEIAISGNMTVRRVVMATSLAELKQA